MWGDAVEDGYTLWVKQDVFCPTDILERLCELPTSSADIAMLTRPSDHSGTFEWVLYKYVRMCTAITHASDEGMRFVFPESTRCKTAIETVLVSAPP